MGAGAYLWTRSESSRVLCIRVSSSPGAHSYTPPSKHVNTSSPVEEQGMRREELTGPPSSPHRTH